MRLFGVRPDTAGEGEGEGEGRGARAAQRGAAGDVSVHVFVRVESSAPVREPAVRSGCDGTSCRAPSLMPLLGKRRLCEQSFGLGVGKILALAL